MIRALSAWFQALGSREQRTVQIGAAAAVLLVVFGALLPFERRVGVAQQRVAAKQVDLAWLQSLGPQLVQLRSAAPVASSHESLVVLVDRLAREAGIARTLAGSQPSGDGSLSVRLDQVPFDALAVWAGALVQRYGVHIASASVDGAGPGGLVNASFVLRDR
jgi:type II secretory pathway component PulM